MKTQYFWLIIGLVFTNQALQAQNKKLPVGTWKTKFKGGEAIAEITPNLYTMRALVKDTVSGAYFEDHKSEFPIIKVIPREGPFSIVKIIANMPDDPAYEISFLWRADDEILVHPFGLVLYSLEKYEEILTLPEFTLSDRQEVYDFMNKFQELLMEAYKQPMGSSGIPLIEQTLIHLGYYPFMDLDKLQKGLEKYIKDEEIHKIGLELAKFNKLFENFK